jgi:hypothetical protein
MHRRNVIGVLLGACAGLSIKVQRAAAWELITQDQFEEINRPKADAVPGTHGDQSIRIPVIEIIEPNITKPFNSPVKIRIRFQAPADASIDPGTFRATYGWFNITNQLLAHAKIDPSGISADDAEIPSGKYKITLQISDTKGRVGTQEFDFQVA